MRVASSHIWRPAGQERRPCVPKDTLLPAMPSLSCPCESRIPSTIGCINVPFPHIQYSCKYLLNSEECYPVESRKSREFLRFIKASGKERPPITMVQELNRYMMIKSIEKPQCEYFDVLCPSSSRIPPPLINNSIF